MASRPVIFRFPDPPCEPFGPSETASEFLVFHRYETAFDLQFDRAPSPPSLSQGRPAKFFYAERTQQDIESKPAAREPTPSQIRLGLPPRRPMTALKSKLIPTLSLQSWPAKKSHAERTQQDIESKPAAIEAALQNPAPSATTAFHEGSGQGSSGKRFVTRRHSRTHRRHPPRQARSDSPLRCPGKIRYSSPPRHRPQSGIRPSRGSYRLIRRIHGPPTTIRGAKMRNTGGLIRNSFLPPLLLKIRRAARHLR